MTKRSLFVAALALLACLAAPAARAETLTLQAGEQHTWQFDPAADIRYQVNSLGQPSSGWLEITFAADEHGMSLQEFRRYSLESNGRLGRDSGKVVSLRVGVDTGSVSAGVQRR
jgi:hypothetical protein